MKRILYIAVILLLSISIAQTQTPSVENILSRHAEAMGGMKLLAQFKSFHYKAEVSLGTLTGSAEMYIEKPDNMIVRMDLAVMKIEQGIYNGEYWMKDQTGKVRPLAGDEKKQIVTEMILSSYEYLLDPNMKEYFRPIDNQELEGKSCYTLRFEPPGGAAIVMLFDPDTYLIMGTKTIVQGILVISSNSDWRVMDGYKIPFRTVQDLGNPLLLTTVNLTGVEINEDFPEIVFIPPQSGTEKYRFDEGAVSDRLDFELNVHHVYIPVTVNGVGPFMFLLDSGAGMSVIGKSLADSLKLDNAGSLPAVGVAGIDVGNFAKVDSLRLGKLILLDFAVGVIDLGFADSLLDVPIQGILGYDLFSRLIVEIDYPAGKLAVYNPQSGGFAGGNDTIEIEIENNHPVAEAYINDTIAGRFRFDTGSQNYLDLNTPFVKQYKLLESALADLGSYPIVGIGGQTESNLVILSSFTIGRTRIDSLIAGLNMAESGIFAAENIDGNIGGGLMKVFRIGFDYPGNRLYLSKTSDLANEREFISSGIFLDKDGDYYVVKKILNGTDAEKSKLQTGDKLLTINGINLSRKTIEEVYELLDGISGDTVKVEIMRDEKTEIIDLPR